MVKGHKQYSFEIFVVSIAVLICCDHKSSKLWITGSQIGQFYMEVCGGHTHWHCRQRTSSPWCKYPVYWAATLNTVTNSNEYSSLYTYYIFNHQGSHEQRKPRINKEFHKCIFQKMLSKLINSLEILCRWCNIVDYNETCLQASQHDNISRSVERKRHISWQMLS